MRASAPEPSGVLNPSHVTSSECSDEAAPSSTPRRMAICDQPTCRPRSNSIRKAVHWTVQRRPDPPSGSTITRDTHVGAERLVVDIAVWCHDHPLASVLASGSQEHPFVPHLSPSYHSKTRLQDVGASKTPLPLRGWQAQATAASRWALSSASRDPRQSPLEPSRPRGQGRVPVRQQAPLLWAGPPASCELWLAMSP